MPSPDALVLCGGLATRLGGVEKPLQLLAGRPLLEHVLARLQPQVGRLAISANRETEAYARYGHPVVDDGARRDCGPLAGIAAGLAQCRSEFLLCVPGDAPLLPADLAARLEQARGLAGADLCFVDDGSGPQPLCVLIRYRLLDDLLAYLDAGGRTPREWYRRHAAARADFSDWPRWAWSLNTPSEWQAAEAALAALTLPR